MPFLLVPFTFSHYVGSTLYCFATRAHLCIYLATKAHLYTIYFFMHDRCRLSIIDARIPTMPAPSTSSLDRPGQQTLLAPATKQMLETKREEALVRRVALKDEVPHPTKNR